MSCILYTIVSLLSYVMFHTKSDIKGFVCILVIVDSLTKLLPGLFMIVLLLFYTVSYTFFLLSVGSGPDLEAISDLFLKLMFKLSKILYSTFSIPKLNK